MYPARFAHHGLDAFGVILEVLRDRHDARPGSSSRFGGLTPWRRIGTRHRAWNASSIRNDSDGRSRGDFGVQRGLVLATTQPLTSSR
jgi:hypothetical protein